MPHSTLPARLLRACALALAACLLVPATHAAPNKPPEKMTINLVHAEISSAVQAVAAATGRNFIVDPRVKGQITLQFEKPVEPSAVYQALLTQLRLAGYAVVETDGVFRVVPGADARLQTTPVGVGDSAAQIPGKGDQVVTQIFQLRNQPASNLLPVLRPLISPNNTINVDPGSNALVITDYADNLKRLARIIAGLDIPSAGDIDIIPLHYATATELAATLQKLIDMQSSSGPARPGPVIAASNGSLRAVVVADAASNALIVRAANGAQLLQIERMVAKLDRPDDTTNIHVVYLHNASAANLAKALRGVLGNSGGSAGSGSGAPRTGAFQNQSTAPGGLSTSSITSGSASGGNSGSSGGGGLGQSPGFTPQPGSEGFELPGGASVYADVAMNALIINAPGPIYAQLRKVIDKLDVRRAQVYVEALIAEVDANKAAQIGIQWQAIAGSAGNTNAVYGGSNFGGSSSIVNLQAGIASGATNFTSALASGALAIPNGLNIGVLHRIAGATALSALANFLQTQDGANILSEPTLMTLDNEEAKIVVGQNVPFITGQYAQTGSTSTVNPFQTYDRQDVGLTLEVRPQITAGNTVRMDVYQEVSSIANATNASGIITNKRSIQTSVLVDDGQTIVLGGLMQDNVSDNNSKIPGLGDIPGIGALFRSTARNRQKTDLMVFLRPVIVRSAQRGTELSDIEHERMRGLQIRAQLPHSLGMPDLPAPLLPALGGPGAPPAPAAASAKHAPLTH